MTIDHGNSILQPLLLRLNCLSVRTAMAMKNKKKYHEEELLLLLGSAKKESPFSLSTLKIITVLLALTAVTGLSVNSRLTWSFIKSKENDIISYQKPIPVVKHRLNCSRTNHFIKSRKFRHGLTDDQLFQKVSLMQVEVNYGCRRMPKIAFMFLTRGPLPLAPLWEKFFHGHKKFFSVYVHHRPGYKLNVSRTSAFYGRSIPSQNVVWGTISVVDAERRLLANALLDISNERFVLLSETCIPVFRFSKLYNYLIHSVHSYVESFDEYLVNGYGRYKDEISPYIEIEDWRKGTQWFEMNRVMAVDIVTNSDYYSVFSKHFTGLDYPDEHYVATYANMFRGSMNSNRTVTWTDWSMGGAHPAMFDNESDISVDFIKFLRNNGTTCTYNNKLSSVCFLFARKFAPSALDLLLNISSTAMGY